MILFIKKKNRKKNKKMGLGFKKFWFLFLVFFFVPSFATIIIARMCLNENLILIFLEESSNTYIWILKR